MKFTVYDIITKQERDIFFKRYSTRFENLDVAEKLKCILTTDIGSEVLAYLSAQNKLYLSFAFTMPMRSLTAAEEEMLNEPDEWDYECDDGYDRWDELYDDHLDWDGIEPDDDD